MTAISATSHSTSSFAASTRFDRALLRAASALDGFVSARLATRAGAEHRRARETEDSADTARRAAQALASIGILPR